MDNERIFIIESRGYYFTFNCADVLFDLTAHNHDLPLASILGDATVPGAALAARLQENRLVLALDQYLVHLLDLLQLKEQTLFTLLYFQLLLVEEIHGFDSTILLHHLLLSPGSSVLR